MVEAIGTGRELAGTAGTIRFVPTKAFRELAGEDINELTVRPSTAQGSNTAILIGNRLFDVVSGGGGPGPRMIGMMMANHD